jgi:hypothetical protein
VSDNSIAHLGPQLNRRLAKPLERKLDRQLQLSGIANTLSQEAVEVEQRRSSERIDQVLIVKGIEHLDDGNQGIATVKPKLEWALLSPILGEVLVVFPQ